jgi:DNA repair protein RadC
MTIQSEYDTDDRPRERLARCGPSSLAVRELLALVLGHGVPGRTAVELAGAVLREAGGVHGLTKISLGQLNRIPGMGPAQSGRVLAAVELGRRTLAISPRAKLPLRTPEELAAFLLPKFGSHPLERFGAVLLDSRHRFLRLHVLSEGGLDATIVQPRDLFREATLGGASAVVVFHNHPSGDSRPTRDDLDLTRRLIDAGRIVGIDVVDHLILTDTVYCSLRRLTGRSWNE